MNIARGLILLLAVPLIALLGLGYFVTHQLAKIESHSEFMNLQVESLSALGSVARYSAGSSASVRTYLLAQDKAEQSKAAAALRQNQAELNRLLARYADNLVSSDEDRRMLMQFQDLNRRWFAEAEKLISLTEAGQHEEAITRMFNGTIFDLGLRSTDVYQQWLQLNERLAVTEDEMTLSAIRDSRRNLLIGVGFVMALSATLGFIIFRRIVIPIRSLQTSVETIAAGDYRQPVPFTQASDETGALARSIDVLKAGAATMAEQRWVKANIAKLTGALQGAASHAEFGQRLLSGLVPVLGGGVAGFYLLEDGQERLRRIADYGLAGDAGAGGSMRARPCIHHPHQPAPGLSPDFLRTRGCLAGTGCCVAADLARQITGRDRICLLPRARR